MIPSTSESARQPLWVTFVVILAVLCGNELGFLVRGGEEQYLAFAKQFMDPGWIPDSFSLTEFAGTRLLFQVLVGSLLKFVSIVHAVFLLRLLACIGMAYALARLLYAIQFRWYWSFVAIQLFVMSEQSFFGLEWIIQSFEPKVVAYIFVFLALEALIADRLRRSAVLLALSTYFHFLVGGWMVIAIGLYLLSNRKRGWFRQFGLSYGLLVLPFVVYLFSGYFNAPEVETSHNLDWVYCYYRLPHHLGIFVSTELFVDKQLTGVVLSAVVLAGALISGKHVSTLAQPLRQLLIIALTITLLFVPVAWADANLLDFRLAGILKYYPFRLSGMAMFLTIALALDVIGSKLGQLAWGRYVMYAIIGIAILLFVAQTVNHIKDESESLYTEAYLEAVTYVRTETPTDAVFAIINTTLDNDMYNAFIRLSGRENFSVKKFVPGESHKLNLWYDRQLDLIAVNMDNGKLQSLGRQYGVTHVLSPKAISGYEALFENNGWHVYSLE